jgi:hypothetical protein
MTPSYSIQILLAVVIFGDKITHINVLGLVICGISMVYYKYLKSNTQHEETDQMEYAVVNQEVHTYLTEEEKKHS